jgi:dephospho-CoA kinase
MLNIGLTGGIGSGKSTVARFLEGRGAVHLDIDRLAHELEEPGGPVWKEIVASFGTDILAANRSIDRDKLGEVVFPNPEKRELLNRIVHPAVYRAWKDRVRGIGENREDAIVISDIPLLIEVGWEKDVDLVLLVHIPPDEQVRRVMKRNGITRREALERLHSQMPIDDKVRYAHVVIHNEGTPAETERQIDLLWPRLVEMERQRRAALRKAVSPEIQTREQKDGGGTRRE